MLWLCLRFPLLPLEVFSVGGARSLTSRAAVVMHQHRVLLGNKPATEAGIKPGLTLATAQALCAELAVFDRDEHREARLLKTLAYGFYRFTPTITLGWPGYLPRESGYLLLEISGCLKLFKGLPRLLRLISKSMDEQGHAHTLGLAPTPKAATLLSHVEVDPLSCFHPDSGIISNTNDFQHNLYELPLVLLDCPDKLKGKFLSTGFHKLGDLLILPGPALGRRYGRDFLKHLKQLTGELADLQQNLELPPRFASTLDFNDTINSAEMLVFPMKRLLLALSGYLHGRQLHCQQIRWRMGLAPVGQLGATSTDMRLSFARPHNQLAHFLSLSRLRLEQQRLPGPVESLTLHADQFMAAKQKNTDLFGGLGADNADRDDDLLMVLDKLRTRLGENNVHGLSTVDSHIPEQAWTAVPLNNPLNNPLDNPLNKRDKTQKTKNTGSISAKNTSFPEYKPFPKNKNNPATEEAVKPPTRPRWLLAQPLPVRIHNQQLYWQGPLELLRGPERIEGNWWQQAICRDYFIARHDSGALYWLYQDRLNKRWFIHGLFA